MEGKHVNQALEAGPFVGLRLLDVRIALNYASTVMDSETTLWLIDGFLLFVLFVVAPSIAAAIGYAAWKCQLKNFGRGLYWTAFVTLGGVSGFLLVFAQRMQADVRTWQYLLQLACFVLGALLLGVAMGCAVAIFTFRWRALSQKPPDLIP